MRNRRELKKYRSDLAEAAAILRGVEELARRTGSMIQWGKPGDNGLVWRRVGDDQWQPLHDIYNYEAQEEHEVYPSSHVAITWQGWHQIKRLPSPRTYRDR